MKTQKITSAICGVMLLASFSLNGCSGDKEEKGMVEQASDKVAAKVVEQINKPLDKAKASQAVQNAQSQQMEDMVKESEEQ
jgi:hypothetical protein